MEGEGTDRFARHWRLWVLIFWLATAGVLLWERWIGIRWFALGDTDDNMRIMQVRALLEGQGWYDMRQYRLNPPHGANIHWSRLVDLPLAAIRLIVAPFTGGPVAEKAAVAIAPLLPMAAAMMAVAVTARRLIALHAFALAVALLVCGHSARAMWAPLRIDHHGWQLAFLAIAVMAMADPRRARGGVTLGIATALSFTIGMEMLPYLAPAGVVTVLLWVRSGEEAPRLLGYGASLAGGCALSYLLFTSYDNRSPVCDALSPVWLSAVVAAGAIAAALVFLKPRTPLLRLAAAAVGGVALATAFALAWPHCLGRLEQSTPLLEHLWLSRVREAMPVYRHSTSMWTTMVSLPIIGIVGYTLMLWRDRRDPHRLAAWGGIGLLALVAALLLLWQTRAAPAAQLLAVPGATGLGMVLIGWLNARTSLLVRVAGTVGAFFVISGLATMYAHRIIPQPARPGRQAVETANRTCPTMVSLRPVALQRAGTVLTFLDLGPRLITLTPHNAVAGPYHRNAEQIVDVMRTWRGDAANARRTADRYRADYILICPNLSESTIYRSEAPKGFYMQLMRGQVPGWMQPVTLPHGSPYRMWRIVRR